MVSEADKAVLKESWKNSRRRRAAIHILIRKVTDDDLALDLNRQACRFMQLEEKIQNAYMEAAEPLPEEYLLEKTRLWGKIQMNTLLNASTSHLASMMIAEQTEESWI